MGKQISPKSSHHTHTHKENLGKKHFSEDTEKQPKSKSVDKFGGGGFQHLAQTEQRKRKRERHK